MNGTVSVIIEIYNPACGGGGEGDYEALEEEIFRMHEYFSMHFFCYKSNRNSYSG